MPIIPIADGDIAAARALRAQFARFWSTADGDPRDVYDRFVAATPLVKGTCVAVADGDPGPGRWVRPAGAATDRVLLFLHGGGYGLGSAAAYAGFVSHVAAAANSTAFVLDYPRVPEARLPVALDLAVETLTRLRRRYPSVILAGDSAGGGLTLATAAAAVSGGTADVTAVAVFSPWTDLSLSGASVADNAVGDPLLDPGYLRESAAGYLGAAGPDDPRASPLFGVPEGLPPILIQVGTDEILLDDSRRYAEAVSATGGQVRLEVWQGMHHVFQLNVEELASARNAVAAAGRFLSAHVPKESARQAY